MNLEELLEDHQVDHPVRLRALVLSFMELVLLYRHPKLGYFILY
jgi:hypothetical protein